MRSKISLAVAVCLVMVLVSGCLGGTQRSSRSDGEQLGQLFGVVTNESGYPIAGAKILLEGGNAGVHTADTDEDGTFLIGPIPSGTYWASVAATSYQSLLTTPVTVNKGQNSVEFKLKFVIPHDNGATFDYYLQNNTDVTLRLQFPPELQVHGTRAEFGPERIATISGPPGKYTFRILVEEPPFWVPVAERTIWIYRDPTNGEIWYNEDTREWIVYTK